MAGGHVDIVGTLKVILGVVVLTLTWVAWAVLAGVLGGLVAGLAAFVVGPLSGFVALRYGERLALRREALRAGWLRATRGSIADAVADQRRALTQEVEAGLAAADAQQAR
jgi:hypothetical protein